MATKIRVLNDHTINQIAAGEVIENPASVVKELVENSIDAGSTDICVEISAGGRQLIRVTDNGCGMVSDDALLCLERHATSKIRSSDDLFTISTMGFRGEAIPSIASISKFTLLTSPIESPKDGTLVVVDGGKIIKTCHAERSPGTTIEVKSLFFNVPVRKKFQRSPNYDAAEILKTVSLAALANPHIKFQLINNQNSELSTTQSQSENFLEILKERATTVLGTEFISETLPVNEENDEYHLQGYLSKPTFSRHNRTGQYLFINGRPVFSPFISFCIRDGYGMAMAAQRFPLFVLHLKMPGALIDVNVHPQKREVRLRQEQMLKLMITKAIEKVLQSTKRSLHVEDFSYSLPSLPDLPQENPTFISPAKYICDLPLQPNNDKPHVSLAFDPLPFALNPKPATHAPEPSPFKPNIELRSIEKPLTVVQGALNINTPKQKHTAVGTLKNWIIVIKNQDTLVLIDIEAAQQRILFERLLKGDQKNESKNFQQQPLLIPLTLELNAMQAAVVNHNISQFETLGIGIHQLGTYTFAIDALPSFIKQKDGLEIVRELITEFQDFADSEQIKNEKIKRIAAIACRQVTAENYNLSLTEAQWLVDALMACENPEKSPKNRPTMLHLDAEELKKLF